MDGDGTVQNHCQPRIAAVDPTITVNNATVSKSTELILLLIGLVDTLLTATLAYMVIDWIGQQHRKGNWY